MSLKYDKFKEYYERVVSARDGFRDWMNGFLTEEALRTLALVRPLTPVKTGNLRRNWTITDISLKSADTLEVSLVNNTRYASFMEYGFTYYTKSGPRWWEGKHMAEIAITKVKNAMPARYSAELKKYLKELGIKRKDIKSVSDALKGGAD